MNCTLKRTRFITRCMLFLHTLEFHCLVHNTAIPFIVKFCTQTVEGLYMYLQSDVLSHYAETSLWFCIGVSDNQSCNMQLFIRLGKSAFHTYLLLQTNPSSKFPMNLTLVMVIQGKRNSRMPHIKSIVASKNFLA